MSDNEDNKSGEAQRPAWVENFIKRLEAEGYVCLDSFRWVKPEDIPVMAAKRKIRRARRRRALLGTLLGEAKTKRESGAA